VAVSVRYALLALLAQRPMYGYQLKSQFEGRLGQAWPLNVGQVYTTLARLERDGLVEAAGAPDEEGRIAYRLTSAGRTASAAWWTTPVDRAEAPRDELVIKLALAVTVPGIDVPAVVQTQRTQTLRQLQDLTRLKQRADAREDLAWLLVLDNLVFAAEAEVRWLDHVEARLVRDRGRVGRPAPEPAYDPGPPSADAPTRPPTGAATARTDARTDGTDPVSGVAR
jgi:DNA-binding PadR family transcriptional regulator